MVIKIIINRINNKIDQYLDNNELMDLSEYYIKKEIVFNDFYSMCKKIIHYILYYKIYISIIIILYLIYIHV
jgi:hypothetical protein